MLLSDSVSARRPWIVSGRVAATIAVPARPIAVITQKLDCQPKCVSRKPPIAGARIGTTPMIDAITASSWPARTPEWMSRTIVRPRMTGAAAATACRKRAAMRVSTLGATMQMKLATV